MLQSSLLAVGNGVVALGRGARRGSGLVVAQDRVVTLRHPLQADRVEVSIGGAENVEARVMGVDDMVGLAVLEVETGDAPAPRWATSMPALGTQVYALGNPGSGLRITDGRVSAGAVVVRSRHGRRLEAIEHTAPMPRGAGGGPLVDEHGTVLGLNALRLDPGFLLALPVATVRTALEGILAGRPPTRLGLALAPPDAGRRMRTAVGLPERDGLLVLGVEDASPAERAGIAAGDLLVALADVDLKTVDDLHGALDRAPRTESIELRVVRATDERVLAIDLTAGGSG